VGLHVYCVVPVDHAPPAELRGLGGSAVALLECADLGVWVGGLAARPVADVAAARAHNHVVAAAMNDAVTPVPARFGQWFEDGDAARAKIAADAAHWRGLLERFRGRAEYGVRVHGLEPVADEAAQDVHAGASGTRYMQELKRRHGEQARRRAQGDEVAASLAQAAGVLLQDARSENFAEGVAVAHLVAWNDVALYHTAMRRVEAARRDLRFLFTGPWPPYSFVE